MPSYKIGVQATPKKQFRVVLFSADNGKLIMQGEPLKNRKDANDLRDTFMANGDWLFREKRIIPATKKWPGNKGPKKTSPKVAATNGLMDTALTVAAGRSTGRNSGKDRFAKAWAKVLKSGPKKAAKKAAKKK